MCASWHDLRIFLGCLLCLWDTGTDWMVVVVWFAGLEYTGRHYWWAGFLCTSIAIPTFINSFIVLKQIDKLPIWTLLLAICGLSPIAFAVGMLFGGDKELKKNRFYLTKVIELFMEAIPSGVLQLYVLFWYSPVHWGADTNTGLKDIIVWVSVFGSIFSIGAGSVSFLDLNAKTLVRGTNVALNFVSRSLSWIMIPIFISNFVFGLCLIAGIVYIFEFAIILLTLWDNEKFNCFEKLFTASIISMGNVFSITSFCFRWVDIEYFNIELHVRFLGEVVLLLLALVEGSTRVMPWAITGLACAVTSLALHHIESCFADTLEKTTIVEL